jgi:hypothetical protein
MTAFGLELDEPLPEGWTPLEAIVIVKALDETGKMAMFNTATPALNVYEAAGMVRATQLDLERGMMEDDDDDDDE